MADCVLTLTCPDRPGIVHAVSGFLAARQANITESQQYGDPRTSTFFMRVGFTVDQPVDEVRTEFARVADDFAMTSVLRDAATPERTMILVSRQLHCLNDLLFRMSTGALPIDVPLVVSNHRDAERLVSSYGLEFVHVPVFAEAKEEAEQRIDALAAERGIELVVLARYMQVISDDFCRRWTGRLINIHHSFLPSFKGAKPYHQAHDRGVKLIGATAHYVTADLDEGPIIEQDVIRADHAMNERTLVSAGQDVEAQVLARAVRWHAQSRILLNGHRTVVFR